MNPYAIVALLVGAFGLGWGVAELRRAIAARLYTRCMMCNGVGYYNLKPPGLDKVLDQSRAQR